MGGEAAIKLNGADISITQTTDYPWDGAVLFDIAVSKPTAFALKLRIPSFAQSCPDGNPLPGDLYRYLDEPANAPGLSVADQATPIEIQHGYATVSRVWEGRTRVCLNLPMSIRRVVAHPAVAELQGKVALERGPLVYALEAADNPAPVLDLALDDAAQLRAEHAPDLLGGITLFQGNALDSRGSAVQFTAIPYYAWGHRGDGQMTVWLNRR